MQNDCSKIEYCINYNFNKKEYLKTALIHPSYANENKIDKSGTNQRLEFLGDSVLELVSSEFLYNIYPQYDEGKLTKIRAKLVCEESLSEIARELHLNEYLLLGRGESKEKVKNNNSIMCDLIEAIIGAIYLDGGLEEAKKFVKCFILTKNNLNKTSDDYKSIIQEYANARNIILKYDLIGETGPDYNKEFYIDLYYGDKLYGNGIGKSKKEAEQNAAKISLIKLYEENKCF